MKNARKNSITNYPLNTLEAEIAITALHATGNYFVLRRLDLENDLRFTRESATGTHTGLCLDTETTGLNHATDKIIEMGIVAFEYNPTTAQIIKITGRYSGFEDPGSPLSEVVKEVTGITDAMLVGQAFADEQVTALAARADLVIAHNATFDRKFVENRFPVFTDLPWACSLAQIDWQAERISSRSLEYLLYKCGGWCINAHRALDDAEGVLGLLLDKLPTSSISIFKTLLARASENTSRIYAVAAPFDKKDLLKLRGYKWDDGTGSGCKSWWREVPDNAEHEELKFLAEEIYPRGNTNAVEIQRIDASSRFSAREFLCGNGARQAT